MNPRRGLILVLIALAAALVWLFWPRPSSPDSPVARPAPRATATATATVPPSPVSKPVSPPPEARSELADQLNAPSGTIQADLRIVRDVIDAYRSNFHENPVGTNAEITAVLTGRNRLLLVLIPNDHPALNLKGELCDRWGRPFFFHQLSGTRMEIRSGGPDQTMWTDDDVVLTP